MDAIDNVKMYKILVLLYIIIINYEHLVCPSLCSFEYKFGSYIYWPTAYLSPQYYFCCIQEKIKIRQGFHCSLCLIHSQCSCEYKFSSYNYWPKAYLSSQYYFWSVQEKIKIRKGFHCLCLSVTKKNLICSGMTLPNRPLNKMLNLKLRRETYDSEALNEIILETFLFQISNKTISTIELGPRRIFFSMMLLFGKYFW